MICFVKYLQMWQFCSGFYMLLLHDCCVFSPGFDRFILGFDRFIPGFDRFIPASIPLTGTLLLQSKYTLVNNMCICDIILFYLIWNKYFLIKKKNIYHISDQIFSWKIQLIPISVGWFSDMVINIFMCSLQPWFVQSGVGFMAWMRICTPLLMHM